MIEIQPVERVNMTQRIDQVRRRIAAIEEKIGINGADFQATLEREIARQAKIHQPQAISDVQKVSDVQKLPGVTNPVNENDAANSAKVAKALREAEKVEINPNPPAPKKSAEVKPAEPEQNPLPEKINPPQQAAPKIERVEVPGTELEIPTPDDKIFEDNYIGASEEFINVEDYIMQTAQSYGVDPRLVRAIAIAESDMNQAEISPVGAIGVMQLMPETAASLGVNPYNTSENIAGGTKYLKQMLDTFDGDVPLAVAAYNAGPGAVKRYGGIPPFSETQNYVGRVMDIYQ